MTDEKRKRYQTLARNLCAAAMANHLRISIQTALRSYVRPDDEIGENWYDLAEALAHDSTARLAARLIPTQRRTAKSVQ